MVDRNRETNWNETLEIEQALVAIARRECDHAQPLKFYIEKRIGRGGSWIRFEVSIHPEGRRPSYELITEIRRALRLSDPTKEYKDVDSTHWLNYTGVTSYGFAEITIFGICQITGTREKTIAATPEKIIPEQVIEARPERVETVSVRDCAFIDGETPSETLTEPSDPSSESDHG